MEFWQKEQADTERKREATGSICPELDHIPFHSVQLKGLPCRTSGRCGGICQVWPATMAASEAPTAARARAKRAAAHSWPSISSSTACWVAMRLASAIDVSWGAAARLVSAQQE